MARRGWLGLFVVFGVIVFLVVEAAAVAAATAAVEAVNYEFRPSALTVSIGDTVVWTMSGDGHTVRSGTVGADNIGHPSDGPLDSGFKGPGETYSFTFAQAGTYEYFCEIHPEQMKGTVTVVAAPANPATSAPAGTAPASPTAGTPAPSAVPAGDASAADAPPVAAVVILIAVAIAGAGLALRRRGR